MTKVSFDTFRLTRIISPVLEGWKFYGIIGTLVILAAAPLFIKSLYFIHLLILIYVFGILSSSWNMLSGYTGIVSLGHQAFFGIGAYISALFVMKLGISPWLGLPIAGVTTATLGILVGLPCLRLKGPYVAIVTLGFAEITRITLNNLVNITQGEQGLWGIPPFPPAEIFTSTKSYCIILAIFIFSIFLQYKVLNSSFGLKLIAIREDQDAANSLGVDVTKHKLLVFALSTSIAGLTGGYYAHYVMSITPNAVVGFYNMVLIIAIVVLGGGRTFLGPVVGSFILILVAEGLRVVYLYRLIIYGILIILIILLMPEGLMGKIYKLTKQIKRVPGG